MIQSLIDQANQHLVSLTYNQNKIQQPLHQKLIKLFDELGEICKQLEDDQFIPLSSQNLPNQKQVSQSCLYQPPQQYNQAGSQSMVSNSNGNISVIQMNMFPQPQQLQQQGSQQQKQQQAQNGQQSQLQQQRRIHLLDSYNIRYQFIDEFQYKNSRQNQDCRYCRKQLFDSKQNSEVLGLDCGHYCHEYCLLDIIQKHNLKECPECYEIKLNKNYIQASQQQQQQKNVQQLKQTSQLDQWNINYKFVDSEFELPSQKNQKCPYCPNLLFDQLKLPVVILNCAHSSHEQCLIYVLQNDKFKECPLCYQAKSQINQQQGGQQVKQQSQVKQQVQQQQFYQKNKLDIIGIQHKKIEQKEYSQYNKSIDNCSICLDPFFDKQHSDYIIQLECLHYFHTHCLEPCLQGKSLKCPNCKSIQGIQVGDQPDGTMDIEVIPKQCQGYQCQTLQIVYRIYPSTVNNIYIPGTERVAFLPHNKEGLEILALLEKAFERKLIFTIGTSVTTGLDNQVVWNGIHHKSSRTGGSQNFGYPDPTYFARVKQELADKGIK